MKKTVCLLLCVLLLTGVCLADSAVVLKAPGAVLMDGAGRVLFEKNAHEKRPIASVTKIMTLLLTMEAVDNGTVSLTDKVTASAHACSMGGSQIWLEEGEQLTVEEMIKAVVICSANDCAVALAELIGGTEQAFVEKMNEKAAELSMKETHFVNACGLDAEGHESSAHDVAVMSVELLRHEKIKEYAVIWQDTLRGGEFVMSNTNKLIKSFDGITGLKTGFTDAAGYCLSATAERGGLALCAVALGCESSQSRNEEVAGLLNYGFANYAAVTPTADRPIMPVPVLLGKSDSVGAELAPAPAVTVKKSDIPRLEKEITVAESLRAPVEKGDRIGCLRVTCGGETIAEIPIVASESIQKLTFFGILSRLMTYTFMR